MSVPAATYILGTLGGLFLLRGIWNPHRSVVRKGAVASCAGPDSMGVCHATLAIDADPDSPIYSCGGGKVVAQGKDFLHIQVGNEPVILFYGGIVPSVGLGAHIWNGQRIGDAGPGQVVFGVWELMHTDKGVKLSAVEPASWLAARGYHIVQSNTGKADLWCEQPRHITVPKAVHTTCGLMNPEPSGFALLPVSIDQE